MNISTPNYIHIRRAYADTVIVPALVGMKGHEQYYQIAGKMIRICFYSTILRDACSPALAHNAIEKSNKIDLTIHVWDSVSSGVDIVAPWSRPEYVFPQVVDVEHASSNTFKGVYVQGEETLSLYDQQTKNAYFWVHDAQKLPKWVNAAPLRTILHWFLSESDTYMVHGAMIGIGERGALITAKGGSGKSSTALACLLEGMEYLADDYGAVHIGNTLTAYSLYASMKIRSREMKDFQQTLHDPVSGKTVAFIHPNFPKQIRQSIPLSCILIPNITHRATTTISPTTKAAAFLALAPTTLFQLPLAESDTLTTLKTIITKIPCYRVELGSDRAEVARTIKAFLESFHE